MSRAMRADRVVGLLGAASALLLLAASAVLLVRAPVLAPAGPEDAATGSPPPAGTAPAQDLRVLQRPELAEQAGADAVLAAALAAARGPWSQLAGDSWAPAERPVYVGRAGIDARRRHVDADLAIATDRDVAGDELVLRLLPAASALGEGIDLDVAVRVDGEPVEARVDRPGARLVVPLPAATAQRSTMLVRIEISYRIPDAEVLRDDGGPASFGLLARSDEATTLGHWLPLLTFEPGAMQPRGDVGAFPPALWSVQMVHDGTFVSGGVDGGCPDAPPDGRRCTWGRGTALRDLSAAVVDDATVAEQVAGGTEVRAVAPATLDEAVTGGVAGETAAMLTSFQERLGPLAWQQLDTVAVPLGAGAAGMEFPGLSFIDVDRWEETGGGLGSYVVAHEVGHQWFHALVGNGSRADPVVDESLAQYLSVLYWRDAYGEDAARGLAERALLDPYTRASDRGVTGDAVPAQALDDFSSDEAYSALVYGRGGYAWVAAEDAVGADAVAAFLDALVREHGLGRVDAQQVRAAATRFDPALGDVLDRWWFDPAPTPGNSP